MLHYAQDLKSPITTLHMLGVVLPILGLVIFPLLGSFLGGLIKWYHLAFLYNLVLPLFVFFMGNNLLSKRPTGYGKGEILNQYSAFHRYENPTVSPLFIGVMFGLVVVLIALLPFFIH